MFATAIKQKHQALRVEGEVIGIQKGKIEGKIETAINMIKKGFQTSIISEVTSLAEEKIEELRIANKE